MSKSIRGWLSGIVAITAMASVDVGAQSPDKAVNLVVGFPPGQSVDIVGRMLADRLGQALGRTVIVDNKPGQGGSLALGLVAKSAPDGNTLTLAALAALVANPHLYKNVQYNTLKDFVPIGLVYDAPLVLVVNPEVPARSVAELVAHAKANPDKLSHSSSGNGTVSHLGMVSFKQRTGIQMLHVPYPGSAKALTDVIAGNVQVAMETVASALPHIKSGRLRMLAVCSAKRLSVFPDTPTVAELGYEGFEAVAWIGMLAPAGTSSDLVQKVNREINGLVGSEQFAARMLAIGAQPRTSTPQSFAEYLRTEYAKWGELVRQSGAKVD